MDKIQIEGLGNVYLYDRDNEDKFGLGRLEDDERLYLVNTGLHCGAPSGGVPEDDNPPRS